MVQEVKTWSEFEALCKDAEAKGLKILIDFTATWCGPCQRIAPIFAELATEMEGKIILIKVDVDANGETAEKFGIEAMPTFKVVDPSTKSAIEEVVGGDPSKMTAMAKKHAKA
uniref:Thioredoxin domain-containing protein n=1 Tax=Chromera velia CCMP2878 TaxID=1169474 RepID=A0A0G4IE57_9ALVE|mmetsp:Transcript_38797/g.76274  ORF Transcript_38797/g.76274 Transcript_38797/m.76274 type:complete len:113 (+) Transcript_38797:136-474(+)|eukprot:Cvel_2404.t1-p1 / transcript=Cvel_2404.t1 / gene=Cvel_2404 / organism=Chromera_velia_CCMP2878 / gene_product=Thioredoxin, putative / transcript_product=Thioredoxin, putative / location=Cvel_scaffold93:142092-142427(+) / protein_length=112 / sequence_SO=supercontig / SO=protein_coding / is_pseudo=false